MGVSTPLQFATKMGALATAVEGIPKSATKKAVAEAKIVMGSGAPSRLRGVGKRGAALGVRSGVVGTPAAATGFIQATGPWQLIESDTKAHQIPRQRESATFVGTFGHAVIPGGAEGGVHGKGGVRTRVKHPGTKGQHPWAKGAVKVAVLAPKVYQVELAASLVSIF